MSSLRLSAVALTQKLSARRLMSGARFLDGLAQRVDAVPILRHLFPMRKVVA
jgi:hypothetical protein